jgi:hypothetical protein
MSHCEPILSLRRLGAGFQAIDERAESPLTYRIEKNS